VTAHGQTPTGEEPTPEQIRVGAAVIPLPRRDRSIRRRRLGGAAAIVAVAITVAIAVTIVARAHHPRRASAVTTNKRAHPGVARVRPSAAAQQATSAAEALAVTRRYARLGLPLYCGGTARRLVALTFDDGPGPHTPAILQLLHAAGAPATFFEIGRNAYQWPQLARAEAAAGTVGDHTWSHPRLTTLKAAAIRSQLADARVAIMHANHTPLTLFRPPYEADDARVNRLAREAGLLPVLWSVDSQDWEHISLAAIKRNLAPALRPGAIILFHEQGAHTLPALRWLLAQLQRRHLQPVTVPELLTRDAPTLAQLHLDARAEACIRP
jgi:peptidoglycan/xylan/chitin deacetylase (PgdA/CDA1 family)